MGRSSVVRQAALACCAALLTLGSGAAVATAAPAPAPSPHSDLPPALVDAIARDLKLTPAQYLQRSDDAQRLAAFADTARRDFRSSFAGVWLDRDGRPTVALAPSTVKTAAVQAARKAGFAVKDVARSEAALQSQKVALDHWFSRQPAAIAGEVHGTAIDALNNTVAVRITKNSTLRLPTPFGPVRLVATPTPSFGEPIHAQPIAGATAGPAEIGGMPYAAVSDQRALRCSLGFNGLDSAGHVVNITAGHCDPDIAAAGSAHAPGVFALHGESIGEPLGYFAKSVLGSHDYSVVRILPAEVGRFSNNLVAVPGQAPLAIAGVAAPVVGMPVCKAGSRTGFSCGTVNAVDQSVQVGDRELNNSFSMNICALPGDSGGPVVSGNRAVGISSASSVADYPICEIPNFLGMITGDVPQLFAQPVTGVLAENPGLRVRTR